MRCKLAALYRLVDLFGWSQSIYNHITVYTIDCHNYTPQRAFHSFVVDIFRAPSLLCQIRVSQEQEHFLLNPFGLLYSEVTASSLIKVDMQVYRVVHPGCDTPFFHSPNV